MLPSTGLSRSEHRGVEICLDSLASALSANRPEPARAAWFETRRAALAHYDREDSTLFATLAPQFPVLVAKMRAQHDEAREIAGHLDDPHLPELEWMQLARRFLALAQHNIIEEERDLFELAAAGAGPGA